jgi:hypothetical protein
MVVNTAVLVTQFLLRELDQVPEVAALRMDQLGQAHLAEVAPSRRVPVLRVRRVELQAEGP